MVWQSILTGRRLRLAFLLSLAANFFFIAVGASIYFESPRTFPPPVAMIGERMAGSLSDEGAELFLGIFDQHKPEIMARQEKMMQAQRQVRAITSAEELDLAALQVARGEMQQSFGALMEGLNTFMMEALPELSVEDRRRLAQTLPR